MTKLHLIFRNLFLLIALTVTISSCQKEYFGSEGEYDWDEEIGDYGESEDEEEGALTLYQISGNQISKIKDYDVRKKYVSYQEDVATHQAMWDYFTQLIPSDARQRIVEFEVFHGEGDILGYVAPIDDTDLSRWKMGLAIDVASNLNNVDLQTEFAYTIIHEVGHVLTLDDTQIDSGTGIGACGAFHIDEGCANPNSYINELFTLGWADIMGEFEKIRNEDENYDFYLKYQDRFVSDYAASNPAEDIAEVFAVFVTSNQTPRGNTIADQKVQAMYERPELVKLREIIRESAVVRAMKAGSWKRPKAKCKHKHRSVQANTTHHF
ncbi:MAG: hypothetical protein ACPGVB_09380 [Chitinophagales bacterium]